jgi:hypothetical protein
MRRKTNLALISLAGILAMAGFLLAQAHESLFGTWTANATKSKYSPGPIPKTTIVKWEASQGDVVPASGDPQHWESSGKFDGKDNPIKGNNPDGDTTAFSKIDARTYEQVTKSGGKTTLTSRIVVAADGKTRITTQTGTNSKGESVHNTMFFEKQ